LRQIREWAINEVEMAKRSLRTGEIENESASAQDR
jgi:hypothetical protein